MNTHSQMRKLVIAGTYAEYRDYLVHTNLHQRAAVYIHQSEQIARFDPDIDEIELVGTYHDNPAYQSSEYWTFQGYKRPNSIAV